MNGILFYSWHLILLPELFFFYLSDIELQKLYWLPEFLSEMLDDFITVRKYYV